MVSRDSKIQGAILEKESSADSIRSANKGRSVIGSLALAILTTVLMWSAQATADHGESEWRTRNPRNPGTNLRQLQQLVDSSERLDWIVQRRPLQAAPG